MRAAVHVGRAEHVSGPFLDLAGPTPVKEQQ